MKGRGKMGSMVRDMREPNTDSYDGRVAARLRELRVARGWSLDQLSDELRKIGADIPRSTLYAYENGTRKLHLALIPTFGRVFGYATAKGWLPDD